MEYTKDCKNDGEGRKTYFEEESKAHRFGNEHHESFMGT